MMHRIRAFLPGAAALIAAAFFAASAPPTSAETTFNPSLVAIVADPAPGANSDITYDFQIKAPDANFGDIVAFLPPEFGVSSDAEVPDGAIVGSLYADITLGLLNSSCSTALPVEMTLYDATTDAEDVYFGFGDSGFYDDDGDGVIEFAEHYPGFLADLFPNAQPVQRIYAQAYIASVWNMVNFLTFEPGAALAFAPEFDESLGYITFAILNAPNGQIYINPVSDFCTPITVINTTFGVSQDNPQMPGDQSGYILRTNPVADGTYAASSYMRSLWDADGDGIESNIDPCRYQPDTIWNPRTSSTAGDDDGDGLPSACDPNDHDFNQDEDGDGYVNRLDFCPLVYDFAYDSDADDVGDACDRDPYDASDGGLSYRHVVCVTSYLTIGAGGEAPEEPPCPGGPDLPVMDLFPGETTLGVGQEAEFVLGLFKTPIHIGGLPGITATFTVEGAHQVAGQCVTGAYGSCEFSYVGTTLGEDTVIVEVPDFGLTGTAHVTWAEAPENDLFANAIEIGTLPYEHTGQIFLSSREDGEPYCGGSSYQGSLWYSYTAEADAMVDLNLSAPPGTDVGVFTGNSVDTLAEIYCSNPEFGYDFVSTSVGPTPVESRHFFEVSAGVTYHISVEPYTIFLDPDENEITISLDTISGISVGDMNCDSEVGVVDALLILRIDAGLPTPDCASAWGDIDCDGDITPIDALVLLIFDAKLYDFTGYINCLPIGWSG